LPHGKGKLSKRVREKEFEKLTVKEVELLQKQFAEIFKA